MLPLVHVGLGQNDSAIRTCSRTHICDLRDLRLVSAIHEHGSLAHAPWVIDVAQHSKPEAAFLDLVSSANREAEEAELRWCARHGFPADCA